jgi:3-oxoadipate CoA-transferase beta subunit
MDLAIGAKRTVVMMEHLTKSGESKLVPQCTYPLTGIGCVRRVYTDLAVIELNQGGPATVIEQVAGLTFAELQRMTAIELTPQISAA